MKEHASKLLDHAAKLYGQDAVLRKGAYMGMCCIGAWAAYKLLIIFEAVLKPIVFSALFYGMARYVGTAWLGWMDCLLDLLNQRVEIWAEELEKEIPRFRWKDCKEEGRWKDFDCTVGAPVLIKQQKDLTKTGVTLPEFVAIGWLQQEEMPCSKSIKAAFGSCVRQLRSAFAGSTVQADGIQAGLVVHNAPGSTTPSLWTQFKKWLLKRFRGLVKFFTVVLALGTFIGAWCLVGWFVFNAISADIRHFDYKSYEKGSMEVMNFTIDKLSKLGGNSTTGNLMKLQDYAVKYESSVTELATSSTAEIFSLLLGGVECTVFFIIYVVLWFANDLTEVFTDKAAPLQKRELSSFAPQDSCPVTFKKLCQMRENKADAEKFFGADEREMKPIAHWKSLKLQDEEGEANAMEGMEAVAKVAGTYVMLKSGCQIVYACLVALVMALNSLDLTAVVALASFWLGFIPEVGAIVAIFLPIPLVLLDARIESFSDRAWKCLWSCVGMLVVKLVCSNIVESFVMGKSAIMSGAIKKKKDKEDKDEDEEEGKLPEETHPVLVLAIVMIAASVWDVSGMIISVPLIALVRFQHSRIAAAVKRSVGDTETAINKDPAEASASAGETNKKAA
jgi:predicted PurR-regulated permease PerM